MKNPLQVKDYYSGDPDENPQESAVTATEGEPSEATSSNRITFSPDDIPGSGAPSAGNQSVNSGNGNPGTPDDDTRKKRHGCRKFLIWFVTFSCKNYNVFLGSYLYSSFNCFSSIYYYFIFSFCF